MYDWWVLQLAKLSVSRKLMVGFGVLLALLLLVVISSNRTLTHQTALSEQLAEVASLMEQAQQAEQGRLAFEAGSDPRQAEQVRQTLAGMLQRLQALRDSELDPAALAHQAEAIEAYRKAFDDLAAADQQRSAARGVLVGTAQQALDSFARLEELMDASLAQQAGDPQALQRSRAVADLHQQLLMVRYQVRGYVFERSDKAEQAAFAAFDALRQAGTTLRGQLPGEADAALEQAMRSLQGYRGGIEQFRAGVGHTRQAQQAMQSSTQDMARAGRTLTEAGRQLRESTASRDRASLWLIAALALAFGCVAGWAINRQIVRPLDEALAQAEAIAAGDLGKRPQNPLTSSAATNWASCSESCSAWATACASWSGGSATASASWPAPPRNSRRSPSKPAPGSTARKWRPTSSPPPCTRWPPPCRTSRATPSWLPRPLARPTKRRARATRWSTRR
ncbi:putative chemotaxis transducer [Pseudomonas aeruginosa]|nr:putative chemotaxis transducer [Pseudomonas aeruginosa]